MIAQILPTYLGGTLRDLFEVHHMDLVHHVVGELTLSTPSPASPPLEISKGLLISSFRTCVTTMRNPNLREGWVANGIAENQASTEWKSQILIVITTAVS